jgi:hypothetical protein
MWTIRQLKSLFFPACRDRGQSKADHADKAMTGNSDCGTINTFGMVKKAPIHFFLHIPKCGGNTFSDYLSRHFPLPAIYTAEKSTADWQKHQQLKATDDSISPDLLNQRYADSILCHDLAAENHFTWRTLQLVANHRPIIVYALLRDPRERIASHYLHLRRIPLTSPTNHGFASNDLYSLARELSLPQFCRRLDRNDVWATIFNLQTRNLSRHHLGPSNWDIIGEQAILDDTLQNITQIDHLADLSDLDEFTSLVSLNNHWLPPGELSILNPGDRPNAAKDMAQQVPDEVVALDQAVVEAGRKQYAQWRKRIFHNAAIALWKASKPAIPSGHAWEISFDDALPGINFHGREGAGCNTVRWMGPKCESQLFLPVRPGLPHTITISFVAFLEPKLFLQTNFLINGHVVIPEFSASGGLTIATIKVEPEQTNTGMVELRIKAVRTISAEALGQSDDKREKSLAICRIRIALR